MAAKLKNGDILKVPLRSGGEAQFVWTEDPPAGGMKSTYFSPDRSYVVQFFHDPNSGRDPQRLQRLEAILTRYNPTLSAAQGGAPGTDDVSANYFRRLFCWPTDLVIAPHIGIGIVAPAYPQDYMFQKGNYPWSGREKNGKWFSSPKLRSYITNYAPHELGNWRNYFQICILIARAVRRLHSAGLAHSDLSCNNVLVDPLSGRAIVIDIDSLVVRDMFPPDVLGTPGYIAPEVMGSLHYPFGDPNRKYPSIETDLFALGVLIYEYLLLRHPLEGPKTHSKNAEEDNRLSHGAKALFIEHPSDTSNRPRDLRVPFTVLGPHLKDLMECTFVKGLHTPQDRPTASEWERALVKTWDLFYPCSNPSCPNQWFILHDLKKVVCPFCGTKVKGTFPVFKYRAERRAGQWLYEDQHVIHHNASLFSWHVYSRTFPGERADRTPLAYCVFHEGRWLLINQALTSLTSPGGNRVAIGQAVELVNNSQIRLSQEENGRIAEVQIVQA